MWRPSRRRPSRRDVGPQTQSAAVRNHRTLAGDVRLVLQIHDELIFEVSKENVDNAIKLIQPIMEDIPRRLGISIPFPVRVESGKTWGTLVEHEAAKTDADKEAMLKDSE